MNIGYMGLLELWFSQGICPVVGLQSHMVDLGFPGGSDGKKSSCNVGDLGSIPGLGRSLGGGHSNSLQSSCLENHHRQRSLASYGPWDCKESDTLTTARGRFILSFFFLRKLHCVLHNGCIHLHCHQQCRRISFSPHPLQHLLFGNFFDDGPLTGVRQYLLVGLFYFFAFL